MRRSDASATASRGNEEVFPLPSMRKSFPCLQLSSVSDAVVIALPLSVLRIPDLPAVLSS